MKRILTILLVCLSFALFSQTIYNPAQIGQTGRNQCTSRGFWVKSDTALFTSLFWIPNGSGAGLVLTSDANGFATWQGGIIYDSLTSLTGETVTLTNNSTYIIAASGTITDVTWSFPTGNTGDVLDIENMNVIVTLNITGVGTGTITAAKITNTKTAGLKTFHNYGGNWY
jgi:hypothetical protein